MNKMNSCQEFKSSFFIWHIQIRNSQTGQLSLIQDKKIYHAKLQQQWPSICVIAPYYNSLIYIGPDKRGYHVIIFLISQQKYMLWVLIRSASARHF